MTPDQAKAIGDFLIADLEREIETTIKVIAAVPPDHLDYQPDIKASTGLGLIRHLPLIDEWFLNSIAEGRFGASPCQSDECGIMNPADAAACYDQKMKVMIGRLRQLSGEQLAEPLDFFGVMQLPAVYFIQLTIKHSIHHRGQLSTYLRSMGGKVPNIYGSSGDS